jgi:ketosteroid isomerase-like protein
MRKGMLVALLMVASSLSTPPAMAQATSPRSSDPSWPEQAGPERAGSEQAVLALANALVGAIVDRDVATLERLLADDFVDVSPDGTTSTRAQFISEYRDPPATATTFASASFAADDAVVRVHGAVAMMTGRSVWHGQTAKGHVFNSVLATTLVALEDNGQWKIAATHSSLVPAQAAAADPSI